MSASVGDSPSEVNRRPAPLDAPADERESHPATPPADDNVFIDEHEDRWHWRRKIRRHPGKLAFYRAAVALAGLLLVVVGLLTGPIPGPGGIPLVLLGLAIWASEFEWAHRLMQRFKAQLTRFQAWSRWQQALFWAVFIACCGLAGYGYMLLFGVPSWAPTTADSLLQRLPGL
jgi:uncharacterized protein (TIGR02611 family)